MSSNSVSSQDRDASQTSTVNATPIAGDFTKSAISDTFVAVPGRSVWVSIDGTFTGTITLKRSIDNGVTFKPLTVGGSPYGVYTGPVQEAVISESESGVQYRLDADPFTSGDAKYSLGHR